MKRYNEKLDKYYTIPYKPNGYDFDGCDCFGLLWLWYKNELGIDLPKYDENIGKMQSVFSEKILLTADINDVVLLECAGDHVGIVIGNGLFIHSLNGVGVAVSKINSWRKKIKGIFHYVPNS